MPIDRSTRTLVAIALFLVAAFLVMDYVIEGAAPLTYWLPLVLFLAGLTLALFNRVVPSDERAVTPSQPAETRQFTFVSGEPEMRVASASVGPETVPYPGPPESSSVASSPDDDDPGKPPLPEGEEDVPPPEPKEQLVSDLSAAPPQPDQADLNEPETVEAMASDVADPDAPAAGAEPEAEPAEPPLEEIPEPEPAAPAEPDDLTQITGIGPKTATVLHNAGVDTYAQLAAKTEDELWEILNNAGLRLAQGLATWNEQAAFLARGDVDGLEAWRGEQRKASSG